MKTCALTGFTGSAMSVVPLAILKKVPARCASRGHIGDAGNSRAPAETFVIQEEERSGLA